MIDKHSWLQLLISVITDKIIKGELPIKFYGIYLPINEDYMNSDTFKRTRGRVTGVKVIWNSR